MNRVLLPLMTSVLFSGSYIAGKYTTLDLGPLTTTLLRYFIALLFLSSLLLHYKGSALILRSCFWVYSGLSVTTISSS